MPRDLLNLAALRCVERPDEDYIPLEKTPKSKSSHHKLPNKLFEDEEPQDGGACYYNYGVNDGTGRHESYYQLKTSSLPGGGGGGAAAPAQWDAVVRSALRVSPEDIAAQLTLLDLPCFRAIQPAELTSRGWNKPTKQAVAPNVVAFTKRFNRLSFWTVQEILNGETPKARAEVMTHFIKVAKKLHELNNIHSLFAVVSAIQSASIFRLDKTWASLAKKDRQTFDKLTDLFVDRDNWANLREYLNSLRLPCIPYLGIFLTDLVYIALAHPAGSPHRAAKTAVVLRAVARYQGSQYALAPLPHVIHYLSSVRYIDELQKFVEDDQYKLSLKLEPPSAEVSYCGSKESVKEGGATPSRLSPSHRPAPGSFRLPSATTAAAKFQPTHRKCRSLGTKFRSASLPRNFHKAAFGGAPVRILSRCAAEECAAAGATGLGVNLLDDTLLEPGAATPCAGADDAAHSGVGSHLEASAGAGGHQGLLKRKTLMKEGRKPTLSSWQRYWVQIWTTSLLYFSPKSFKSSRREEFAPAPCKVVTLAGWSARRGADDPPGVFRLLHHASATLYKFKTSSQESAEEWVSQIQEVTCQPVKPLPDNLLSFE